MKGSGDTFVKAVRQVIAPVRRFTKSYVDDMVCYSDDWSTHLSHLQSYLAAISKGGFTLGLPQREFGKPAVLFAGHIVRSGQHTIDPDKVNSVVLKIQEPQAKKQLRQIIGFFPSGASICRILVVSPSHLLTLQPKVSRIASRSIKKLAMH